MKRLLSLLAWAFVPILASNALAQTGDGYVGIYGDSLGTQACASVPPYTSATLYVIAKTAGQSADGITGAEFRIEVTSPSGWYISYNAPSAANIVSGNAIDTDPDPNVGGGVNLGFPSCQVPDSSGQVKLGTLSVFNLSGSPTNLLVKRHSQPTNAGFSCPLFVQCDDPYYTKGCMTSAPPDSCTLGTQKASLATVTDPTIFTAALNAQSPEGGGGAGSFPRREVVASFRTGVIQLPTGQTSASLQSTVVSSPAVAAVLESHAIEVVAKAFPDFDLADTLGVSDTGDTVRLANWSEVYTLRVPESGDAGLLTADLSSIDDVIYAERNLVYVKGSVSLVQGGQKASDGHPTPMDVCTYPLCSYTVSDCPNDPLFTAQWALVNGSQSGGTCDADIDVDVAWRDSNGHPSTKLAIIGTSGIERHVDVNPVSGDPQDTEEVCAPSCNLGTLEAGVMAARTNNGIGIAGVNWHAQILSQVISPVVVPGSGGEAAATAIVNAIREARNAGARIFHHSWHAVNEQGVPVTRLNTTLAIELRDKYMLGDLAIAPMGDDNSATIQFPVGIRHGMVAVGATNDLDRRATFSNIGSHIDVVAPGQNILSTYQSSYQEASGTGMAAAFVTGLANLLRTVRPDLANDDVEQIIRGTADVPPPPAPPNEYGKGRINAQSALARLESPYRLYHGTVDSYLTEGVPTFVNAPICLSLGVEGVAPNGNPRHFVGFAWAEQRVLHVSVTFPVQFATPPAVWGRGAASTGLSDDGFGYDPANSSSYAYGWCEPVPGSITTTGCELRAYVYDLWNCNGGTCLDHSGCTGPSGLWRGTIPTDNYGGIKLAYTVLGELAATDVGDSDVDDGTVAVVGLAAPNPWVGPGALRVSLTQTTNAHLIIYDVCGRLVRSVHEGPLVSGRHEIHWDGRDESGNRVGSGVYVARLVTGSSKDVTTKFAVLQ